MSGAPVYDREWVLSREYGSEKRVMQEIVALVKAMDPWFPRLEDMRTVVAEACLNAFEHGGLHRDLPITVSLCIDDSRYRIRVADRGTAVPCLPEDTAVREKWKADHPRGWGLFLIRSLSDRFEYGCGDSGFYVDIIFFR